jgi:hypothetical protein
MLYSAHICLVGAIVVAALTAMIPLPVNALTMKECSAKYRAAQSSGVQQECHGKRSAKPTVV